MKSEGKSEGKSASESGSQEEQVGYGRPPKHTQFKPGQSGNPRGRPRGRKNFTTVIRDYAQGPMRVTEGGRDKTLPRFDALQRTMWAQAFQGNAKALAFIIQWLREVGLLKDEPQSPEQEITPEDQEILRDYLRLRGVAVPGDAEDETINPVAPQRKKRRRPS